jgi:hypothetical protein
MPITPSVIFDPGATADRPRTLEGTIAGKATAASDCFKISRRVGELGFVMDLSSEREEFRDRPGEILSLPNRIQPRKWVLLKVFGPKTLRWYSMGGTGYILGRKMSKECWIGREPPIRVLI